MRVTLVSIIAATIALTLSACQGDDNGIPAPTGTVDAGKGDAKVDATTSSDGAAAAEASADVVEASDDVSDATSSPTDASLDVADASSDVADASADALDASPDVVEEPVADGTTEAALSD